MDWIITDIEGTTTSIDFVHKTLFPYAREHLLSFLEKHRKDSEVNEVVRQLWFEDCNGKESEPVDLQEISKLLQMWIDEDKKHPLLKLLQGKVWKAGYQLGHYQSHVYDDVPGALQSWHQQGINLAVYSSGSVEAQKLLFAHSSKGDLTPYFRKYFDTAIGNKREKSSYQKLLETCESRPSRTIFLSDIEEELDAAKASGMHTCQLLRPGTQPSSRHISAKNFLEVAELIKRLDNTVRV